MKPIRPAKHFRKVDFSGILRFQLQQFMNALVRHIPASLTKAMKILITTPLCLTPLARCGKGNGSSKVGRYILICYLNF